jgi:hypothetical protein
MICKVTIMFLISVLCLPFVSFGYEAAEVQNGGSIEGLAVFTGGTVPKAEPLAVSTDLEYCGKTLPAERYLISADKKIKNVVVYVDGMKAGKAIPHESVTVTNLKCAFLPHISVGFKGNKFVMKNDDPLLHTFDIHVSLNGKELYHAGLHEQGSSVTKTLSKTGLMEISCYVHPWQLAYLYIFDHPYAAVTNEKGEFVIKDVPPGTYTVEAWHEALGTINIPDVKVESGKTSAIKLEYTSKINLY